MTQIKMACLSYTSSPITYDHAGGARIEVRDLVRVKEAVLRKAEVIGGKLNEFLVDNQSRYGMLLDEAPNSWLDNRKPVARVITPPMSQNDHLSPRELNHRIRIVTRAKGQTNDFSGAVDVQQDSIQQASSMIVATPRRFETSHQ